MNIKKLINSLILTVCFSLVSIHSSYGQCNSPTITYYLNGSGTTYLSNNVPGIPSSGNSYSIEIGAGHTLRIDDAWNANNVCIKMTSTSKIIIESGHICNLTNATVRSYGSGNALINPFEIEAGGVFQVGHADLENVAVGFKVQGELLLDDVHIDGWAQVGVGVVGPSSEYVTIRNSSFTDLQFGVTLQGVSGNLDVDNTTFNHIDEHGIAASAVSGVVNVHNSNFYNLKTGMQFSSSIASHFISGNTTDNVKYGLNSNGLEDVYFNSNTFTFNSKGAILRNIENLTADENTFSSSQSSASGMNRKGMDIFESNGSISSNIFEGMDIGVYFDGYNEFTNSFSRNEFNGIQTYGLYMENDSRIGPQCHQHNVWLGTFTSGYGAFSPDFDVKYNSTFTVNKNITGEMPKHSPSGWFIHSIVPCETPQEPGFPEIIATGGDQDIKVRSRKSLEEIRVFPNPAIDYVDIDLPLTTEVFTVELRKKTGELMRKINVPEGQSSYRLALDDIPMDMYLLSIHSNSFTSNQRIIVSERF